MRAQLPAFGTRGSRVSGVARPAHTLLRGFRLRERHLPSQSRIGLRNRSTPSEEVAFFVVSPENEKLVRKKAELMMLRGVLRVFSVWVDRGEIREWNPESQSWREAATFHIEDPCLLVP